MAFQCVTPASLSLDGTTYECTSTSFNWFSPPTTVTNLATGRTFLNADKMKTIQARWTLENLNSPIPVQQLIIQPLLPRLSDRIVDYFHKTDPIRASLISGSTICIILILALPWAIRLCCPQLIRPCCPTNYFSHKELTKKKSERATAKSAIGSLPLLDLLLKKHIQPLQSKK